MPECETILDNGSVCGAPAHSKSDEHDGIWKCRSCYHDWLKENKPQEYVSVLVRQAKSTKLIYAALKALEGQA